MKKTELANGQLYHIYNRGVDKREIFLSRQYYNRFVSCLCDFNVTERGQTSLMSKGVPLIDIICFCLMPNHYHLLVRQLVDNGISKFMQKLGTGYTMYFNLKNERSGRLFESKYKVKLIDTDEYLIHLSGYIHLNCLDLIVPDWKESGIKDKVKINNFLENYKWSSYLDYIGKYNFPDIVNKESLQEYFKTADEYKKYIYSWTGNEIKTNIEKLKEITIE